METPNVSLRYFKDSQDHFNLRQLFLAIIVNFMRDIAYYMVFHGRYPAITVMKEMEVGELEIDDVVSIFLV